MFGIERLLQFTVYNRAGQVLYTTKTPGQGWDGTYNGVKQAPGTYVYQLQAIDYHGNTISKKGTFVLIR